MSWLRNSPLRVSFSRRGSNVSPPKDCDPSACFESFKRHWQQANDIICRTQTNMEVLTQDEVLAVVNNLQQILSLLVLELRGQGTTREQPCLEHLLSERILEHLFTWGSKAGVYIDVLRLEQLKLYEILLSNAPQRHLLSHEPFLRPLLAVLNSCVDECLTDNIENKLILLLNQLCVCLTQNPSLLDLFFINEKGPKRFVIFGLLIPFVHRPGGIGQQARDAMMLCMSLSKKNEALGIYIGDDSNVCPVLATGLSGLYSRLPRKLMVETDDWHCLTPDDVNEMPDLTLFLNSLEFCNAVVQEAHPIVQSQMLEFIYHGFLVPVVGPALLQNVSEELVASTAYLDLFLRSITEPGLLHTFLRFLFTYYYDGERVMDKMIQRLGSTSQLCMVSLALFDTLVSFNCEDVMLELVFQYLIPCTHVMLSQRKRIKDLDIYSKSAEKFLSLSPSCCSTTLPAEHTSLTITPPRRRTLSPSGDIATPTARRTDSLYGNYSAYLLDAHRRVTSCSDACSKWVYLYDGDNPEQSTKSASKGGQLSVDDNRNLTAKRESAEQNLLSLGESSGYESFACREGSRESSPELKSETVFSEDANTSLVSDFSTKDSGFEALHKQMSKSVTPSATKSAPKDASYSDMFHATPDIGPFLELLLRQLENMTHNNLYLNLQLTGLISRLAAFPQPLLVSFLLNHSLVFQPSVRSLFQVLGSLKQRIDSHLRKFDNVEELMVEAQTFLVSREERIVNARRLAQDSVGFGGSLSLGSGQSLGGGRRGSNSEPFSRSEPKRRSFSAALTSAFKRVSQGAFLPVRENALEYSPNGFKYHNKRRSDDSELRRVISSAVLLDEWLKELSALAQEHVACHTFLNPLAS